MRHVNDQPDPVHLLDYGASHAGNARILGLITAGRQQRLVVIRELHESHAERMANLHQTDVFLNGRAILKSEKYGGAVASTRLVDVVGPPSVHDQVRVAFKKTIPVFDIGDRVAKIAVVANGRVNGIHAAFAHLPENLSRPVAVLQGVDTNGCLVAHLVGPLCVTS